MDDEIRKHKEVLRNLLGIKSRAFPRWYECMKGRAEYHKQYVGTFIIAHCTAALLELGEPPHPQWLTADTQMAFLPQKFGGRRGRAAFDRKHKTNMAAQYRWNKKFREWSVTNNMYGTSEITGTAQFRKYFTSWLHLHVCKEGGKSWLLTP